MAYITPKTDWTDNDGIMDSDLIRIEGNTEYNHDTAVVFKSQVLENSEGYVSNFKINANNNIASGSYIVDVTGGQTATSASAAVQGFIDFAAGVQKLLSASNWEVGSGATKECKAPGATFANNKWFFIFALYNPTTQLSDIVLDDTIIGANIQGSVIESTHGYTMWKRIGAVKTTDLLPTNGFIPMTSVNQNFQLAGNYLSRVATSSMLTSSTLVTLKDSNNVSFLPKDAGPHYSFPAQLEIEVATPTNTQVTLWHPDFGSSYYDGVGPEYWLDVYVNARVHMTPLGNTLYGALAAGSDTIRFKILSYIDLCDQV